MYKIEQLTTMFEKWHRKRIGTISRNSNNDTIVKLSLGDDRQRTIPMVYRNNQVSQVNRFR